jgi:hypothetical protein
MDAESLKTLVEARARAQQLLAELRKRQAEVDAQPPDLPPEQLAAGRVALQKAIESAERVVRDVDAAMKIAVAALN